MNDDTSLFIPLLFVYGTLRKGEDTDFARRLNSEAQFEGSATVRGVLYMVSDYPGMVTGGTGLVKGDLLGRVARGLLAQLDSYEGEQYRREVVEATTSAGDLVKAWAYIYLGSTKDLRRIDSGDWFARIR